MLLNPLYSEVGKRLSDSRPQDDFTPSRGIGGLFEKLQRCQ